MGYWSMTFPGEQQYLAEVRRFTSKMLGEKPGTDDVVLVASELAGNAIQHTDSGEPGGSFTLHLATFADHWTVRVDDAGGVSEPCVQLNDGFEDEAGRGLALVAAVSKSWGVLGDQYARAVWAEIPVPKEACRG
jgi:anti-sigma regulatory factor (Ser/Thr protein kinase)